MVLLHGATASWRAWRPVLERLEAAHDVWAPTLAGHHGGPPISVVPPLVIEGIVDDICARMDELGWSRAHVVGNSLGGWVALELARRDRALSVVALSPAGAWELPRDLKSLLRLFRAGKVLGSWTAVHRITRIPWVRRVVLHNVSERPDRMSATAVGDMFADMANCDVLDTMLLGASRAGPIRPFDDLDVPIRIAWGAVDRTLPFERYGRPMLAAVPQAEYVVLPGVGHVPMWDDPTLVAETVLEVSVQADVTASRERRQVRSRRRRPLSPPGC